MMSGGSAANTIFAIQAFGGKTAYACKVSNDFYGQHFTRDFVESGIFLRDSCIAQEGATGQCLVLVTPDAERTMATNLGVSADLNASCIEETVLSEATILYIEGYLATSKASTSAVIRARDIALESGVSTALTLSDASILRPFKSAFDLFIGNGIEILFCNEEECLTWVGTDRLDIALKEMQDFAKEIYVTLGEKGSIAVSAAGIEEIRSDQVVAIDTNGAGDMFAGACLFARSQQMGAKDCAIFANTCAGAIVQEHGARFLSASEYKKLL